MVSTMYLTSAFVGHATAENLLLDLKGALPNGFNLKNVLQLSMDGPAVNWKLKSLISNEISDTPYQLLQIGSCGLHVIHNAFKTAFQKSSWKLQEFLRACYYSFKDSPTKRADYIRVTCESTFCAKFVGIRWLENRCVAEKIIKLLPHLRKFVDAIASRVIKPTIFKSMRLMTKSLENAPLLEARLHFFVFLAQVLEPFLCEYQGNGLLVPFLYEELQSRYRTLLEKFVKSDILKSAKSGKDLLKIDLEKKSNQKLLHEIDVGFGARRALHVNCKPKQPEAVLLQFRADCLLILKHVANKLREKSPLQYTLRGPTQNFS